MKKFIVLTIFIGLLTVGCGNEEQKEKNTTQNPSSQSSEQATLEPVEKAEKTNDTQIVKKTAEDLATAVQEKSVPVIEKTGELVETAKEKSMLIVQEGLDAATEMNEKAKETIQNIGVENTIAAPSGIIEIENEKGKISFSHETHGKSLECVTCHGTEEPGPITFTKEAAHKLCKGCHKENQTGPTKCEGCHEKKI